MKKLRWQLIVVALSLVAIVVLLISQQPKLIPGSTPDVEPVTGGIYTEALLGSFGRLNPVLDYYNQADQDINRLIFSSLIKFDHRGLPMGDLADTWGVSQDGKVYNFSIRADANWHDGQPVTSDDIVFTTELLRDDALPVPEDLREFWNQIEIKILDEKTLQFRLPEPFSPFLDYLTFGILPVHHLGDIPSEEIIDADFNLAPVGSGPFYFQELLVQDGEITGVVLSGFAGYYKEKPFLEQIIFKYFQDPVSAIFALKQGEVMGISQLSPDILDEALKSEDMSVFTGRLPQLSLVLLNLDLPEKPFLQDATVRRALMLGLNRNWIIDRLLGGQAILAHGPIFPDSWAYYEAIEQIPFDTEGAISILKRSGYTVPASGGAIREKDGVALSLELVYSNIDPYPQIAEKIRSDWAKLGVEAILVAVTGEELMEDYLKPRSYEAALVEINFSDSPDPDPYPFWHQAQADIGQNFSQWDDRQASEYLEQARVIDDLSERTRRYRNFQVRFMTELPALPLYYPVYSFGISNQVKGVSVGPFYDISDRFSTVTSWFLYTASGDAPLPEITQTP